MTNIQAQLEQLFEVQIQLNTLLDGEQYEEFLPLQNKFSDQIKYLLDHSSNEEMSSVLKQLKKLEDAVQQLQNRSDIYMQQLKDKSLQMKRNKKKVNAYK